ncbi:MAG: SpoIID/LytB domain-containing protein [Vicinamibacterales bacterium]
MRALPRSTVVLALVLTAACGGSAIPAARPETPAPPPTATIRVQFDDRGETTIREIPLDAYAAATGLSEFAPAAGTPAAVEAMYEVQTIVARTYAVAHRGRHARDGFDLCSTTHCQLYEPGRLSTSRWAAAAQRAAQHTAGLVVLYDGWPADTVFHADCGGATSAAADVWGGVGLPYLLARVDDGAAIDAHAAWQYAVDADVLRRLLDGYPHLRIGGPLSALTVVARDASYRATQLRLQAATGGHDLTIAGTALRDAMSAAFGPRALRSTRFEVVRNGRQFLFSGKGFGHGVGLCQAGAVARVTAGADPRAVLAHYYPGTVVGPVPLTRSSRRPPD